jgi:hypothetical protein
MTVFSKEEERVWQYLLTNPGADTLTTSVECAVPYHIAKSCIDRIGTPRDVLIASQKSVQEEWFDDDILYVSASTTLKPTRVQTLETAIGLTNGDRNKAYGPPINNLTDCAELWNTYIRAKQRATDKLELDAEDVAWMMVLVKMTRSFQRGYHPDNYTDASAYSAIAGECREILSKKEKE